MEKKLKSTYEAHNGKHFMNFGKYINNSINYILKINPDYLIWIHKKTNKELPVYIQDELKRLKLI